MKKLMTSLIISSLVLIASSNTSFAQKTKEKTTAELNVAATQEVKLRFKKAVQNQDVQQKKKLNDRPVRTRVKMKAEPAQIKLKKSKM